MSCFEDIQEFIELSRRPMNIDDPAMPFAATPRRIGLRQFASRFHVNPLRPPEEAVWQKRCLARLAQERGERTVSRIPGVDESMAHRHMIALRRRTRAAPRAQGLVKAPYRGDIRLLDIIIEPRDKQPERSEAEERFAHVAEQAG